MYNRDYRALKPVGAHKKKTGLNKQKEQAMKLLNLENGEKLQRNKINEKFIEKQKNVFSNKIDLIYKQKYKILEDPK